MHSTKAMPDETMIHHSVQTLNDWLAYAGLGPLAPEVETQIRERIDAQTIKLDRPATPEQVAAWEESHGFKLPEGLKRWLLFSNGLSVDGSQWIHPLRSIGPTVRFSPSSRLLMQPSTWYEFGNPNETPVNFDGVSNDHEAVIFIVGDETHDNPPRIIARSFNQWFSQLISTNFAEFWHDRYRYHLGDPVQSHYERREPIRLAPRLCKLCKPVGEELLRGTSERSVMKNFEINRDEMEQIIDVFQYRRIKGLKFDPTT